MSYTRASANTHLANELAMLAADAQQLTTDSGGGFGPAIDKALRAMGTAETALSTATVDDASVSAFLALCEYYALVRIWRTLATRADPANVRGVNSSRAQVVLQVKDLVIEAANACAGYGYPVGAPVAGGAGSGGSWQAGSLTLDIIEPWDVSV
jgi:hypothetical protein